MELIKSITSFIDFEFISHSILGITANLKQILNQNKKG